MEEQLKQRVQELQILEQNLQNFSMQKQASQVELNEIVNALEEIKNSSDEVYKIIGGIMLKSEKSSLSKELEEKKKILQLRLDSIQKQEKLLDEKAESIKKEANDLMSRKKSK